MDTNTAIPNIAMHLHVRGARTLDELNCELPIGKQVMRAGLDALLKEGYVVENTSMIGKGSSRVYRLNPEKIDGIYSMLGFSEG
jgi:predicted ArsR family transcriptional regulator